MAEIPPYVRTAIQNAKALAHNLWRSTWHPLPRAGLDMASKWQLLEMVYSDRLIMLANLVLVTILGSFGVIRHATAWSISWLVAGLLIGVLRLWDYYRFHQRRDRLSYAVHRRYFIAFAWILAAHWGSASLYLHLTDDTVIQMFFLNAQAAFISVAAARSSPIVQAAYGQIILVLVPVSIAVVTAADPFMRAYTIIALLFAASTKRLVDVSSSQTKRMLRTQQDNAQLADDIQRSNQELASANLRLQAVAATDGLTGIANRRAFDQTLAAEWGRTAREGGNLSLMLIDIDHFKAFNDRFGHQAGDDTLRQVAACIDATIMRPGDTAARYGGEEFATILPNTDGFGAVDTAERIRRAVEGLGLSAAAGANPFITVSLGVATVRNPCPGLDPEALIAAADRQLYIAKRESRNCVRAEILVLNQAKEELLF